MKKDKNLKDYRSNKTEKKIDKRTSVIIPRGKDWDWALFSKMANECWSWIALIMALKSEWKEDDQLEQDLKTYISQNLKKSEVLDFMQRDFLQYN